VGLFKSIMGFGGVERVGDRIVGELEAARSRGESELVVGYTQSEIGIRGNATQMALFIRRKFEKQGFEVVDGQGGAYGADVRFVVRWSPIEVAAVPAGGGNADPEDLQRSLRAAEESPPPGDEGDAMSDEDVKNVQIWMADRFGAGEYETVWHRRLALGYGLSAGDTELETWFWVNAHPALAALYLGKEKKHHPFVATSAAYAEDSYLQMPHPSKEIEDAMTEIKARFFS
jgi:hypothetical protein